VTAEHVRDVLEHAYPDSLSIESIAESLRCPVELIENYLEKLKKNGIVIPVQNQKGEWIRVNTVSVNFPQQNKKLPTVAIITCLFVEKQSIDAIIEDGQTLHKYSKTGDSGVYTIGVVAGHRVVATKLAMIGDSRDAVISTGNTTTRLLGSFQNIDHVIVVSVAGGIPHTTDPEEHVRLGDVVISCSKTVNDGQTEKRIPPYIYAHNFILNRKTHIIDGFSTRNWAPKDNVLTDAFHKCSQGNILEEWHRNTCELIEKLNTSIKDSDYNFSRPSDKLDQLKLPIGGGNYVFISHPNAARKTPIYFFGANRFDGCDKEATAR